MYFFSARLFAQNILLWTAAAPTGGARTWRPPPLGRLGDRGGGGPAHQTAGHDVAVPQFLGRPDFLAELENAASDARGPAQAQSTRKSEPPPR